MPSTIRQMAVWDILGSYCFISVFAQCTGKQSTINNGAFTQKRTEMYLFYEFAPF
jgi:hypothetical protein